MARLRDLTLSRPRISVGSRTLSSTVRHCQQHGLLKHDADVAGGAQERRAVEQQRAARRPDERADQLEQCRLSTARRTDQRDEFVLLDRETDVLEGRDAAAARGVGLVQTLDVDLANGIAGWRSWSV